MERLGNCLPDLEGDSAAEDRSPRNEEKRLVLPDGIPADDGIANLIAKYRDMPPPKLSAELLKKLERHE